ncbi:hypothetical protein [Paracoccus beibuensis]|uniref:hypothetical protein n=1 Tax=Paracoccus beibuensis TaxID=547602 RepID=UPI0022400C2E|nr:hypothetical protein [Paracoccus beibuensis]
MKTIISTVVIALALTAGVIATPAPAMTLEDAIEARCDGNPSRPAARSTLGGRLKGVTCREAVEMDRAAVKLMELGHMHGEAAIDGHPIGEDLSFNRCIALLRSQAYYIAADELRSGNRNPMSVYNSLVTQGYNHTLSERRKGNPHYCRFSNSM